MRIGGVEAKEILKKIEVNEVRVQWEEAQEEEDRYLEKAWDDVKAGNSSWKT